MGLKRNNIDNIVYWISDSYHTKLSKIIIHFKSKKYAYQEYDFPLNL